MASQSRIIDHIYTFLFSLGCCCGMGLFVIGGYVWSTDVLAANNGNGNGNGVGLEQAPGQQKKSTTSTPSVVSSTEAITSSTTEIIEEVVESIVGDPVVTITNISTQKGGPNEYRILPPTGKGKYKLYVRGTVEYPAGCDDIISIQNNNFKQKQSPAIKAALAHTTVTPAETCSEQQDSCYIVDSEGQYANKIDISGCDYLGDTSFDFEVTFDQLSSNMNPNDWEAVVVIADETNSGSGTDNELFVIESTVAMEFLFASIEYGNVDLGQTSDEQSISILNTGNTDIDIQISAEPMVCSGVGEVPVTNQRYSTIPGLPYEDMVSLQPSPDHVFLNLTAPQGAEDAITDIYFRLQMPESGISGSCTGKTLLTAIPVL